MLHPSDSVHCWVIVVVFICIGFLLIIETHSYLKGLLTECNTGCCVLQWCCYIFNMKQKYVIQNIADVQLKVSTVGITSPFTDISHSQQRRKATFRGYIPFKDTER
jgi:hypothetical protein